ncbi:chemotaxis protein CheW [Herminiimonas sp. CN]|uniref:chemotaxis protein CheW n=1 Tax=Herminiimonas sp. CN TaxID=1349818 RepID=UPI000473FC59|nr:chemotaxis protein CheW [Herminiimonas sp. CN]
MNQPPTNRRQDGSAGQPEPRARRIRLHEFQAQLAQRVQAAQNSTENSVSRLGAMAGDARCLFDLQQISEIMPVRPITKVPLTQDWYLGLSSIRGNLVGVVDFARFLGCAGTAIDAECRIIVFARALALPGGLLVPRVLGLRNPQQMTHDAAAGPDPAAGMAAWPWAMRHCRDAQSRPWTQIDLAALVQDPRFLHIGS